MIKFGSEADMLDSLIPWLEEREWEVYKEVECPGGYTDIVAKKGDYLWGIEGKLTCNETVILQAERSLQTYHINSIAVPRKPNSIYNFYLKQHGIGCLVVEKYQEYKGPENYEVYSTQYDEHAVVESRVGIEIIPEMNENPKKIDKIILHDSLKDQVAGTTGEKRITNYKVTVIKVQEFLNKNGPSTLKEILDNVDMHWSDSRKKYNLKTMMLDYERHKFKREWCLETHEHTFMTKVLDKTETLF